MRSILLFLIGFLLSSVLKTLGCEFNSWQFWACILCTIAVYAVGLLTNL